MKTTKIFGIGAAVLTILCTLTPAIYAFASNSQERENKIEFNTTKKTNRDNPDGYPSNEPPLPLGSTLWGSANGDGSIDISDVVYLINYLFKGGSVPNPLCRADANGDGIVNIGDVVYLISYLYKGGPAPILDCCGTDSDGDGWSDSLENNTYYTNPYDPDTDHDGVNDPQDIDPLVDLSVTLKVKRVYASEYTYTWREGETWDRTSLTVEGKENNSTSGDQPWEILQDPNASNGEFTRQYNRYFVNDWAEWDFTVNKPGVYHVWIRNHRSIVGCSVVWPTWNGEDFFVKKWDDNGPSYDIDWYIDEDADYSDLWQWTWYGAVYMDTGLGTLRIENRHEDPSWNPHHPLDPRPGNPEDYIEIDNILITDDPSCAPVEEGVEGSTDNEIGYVDTPVFDPDGLPDFYIRTYIGQTCSVSPIWYNDSNVLDDWTTTVNVPDNDANVSMTIELWDEDGAQDQLCDISIRAKTCNLVYNLRSGTWTNEDFMDDTDFYGRTCGEVDGEWDYDADVIFELSQNDYDNDGITYWQEVDPLGPYKGSISPLVRNDRYAVIVGAGASCKLMQNGNIGSNTYPYKGTYLRYDQGYSWTDYTMFVDLMTNDDVEPDREDIGVMFRYQDPNNYYLLRWEQNGDQDRMLLWKFVNGVCTEIASPKYTDLAKNQWYTLKITVSGNGIGIWKNTNSPMNGGTEMWFAMYNIQDSSLSHGGIALFTWKNRGAWFDDILVKKQNGDILLSEDFDYGKMFEYWTAVDEASGSSQWQLTEKLVDQENFYVTLDSVYRILRLGVHYKGSNIMYLNADKYRDADGDGTNDVEGITLKESIQYLLESWLSDRSDSNDLNLVYIFDHGYYTESIGSYVAVDENRNGKMDGSENERLSDADVDSWLPYYGTGGINRLTFVVEACFSGGFPVVLSKLGENRIVMSGTSWNKSACEPLGQDYAAFSYTFFRHMAYGNTSVVGAFNDADWYVTEEDYMCSLIEAPFPFLTKGQDPKYNDNGDSLVSDYPLPNNGDGYLGLVTGL